MDSPRAWIRVVFSLSRMQQSGSCDGRPPRCLAPLKARLSLGRDPIPTIPDARILYNFSMACRVTLPWQTQIKVKTGWLCLPEWDVVPKPTRAYLPLRTFDGGKGNQSPCGISKRNPNHQPAISIFFHASLITRFSGTQDPKQ